MDTLGIKTIRIHNFRWSKSKAVKFAQKFIDIIAKKYPMGIEEDIENKQYFVIPGFEHVTKHQPIVRYNPAEGAWELSSTNFILQPEIN